MLASTCEISTAFIRLGLACVCIKSFVSKGLHGKRMRRDDVIMIALRTWMFIARS